MSRDLKEVRERAVETSWSRVFEAGRRIAGKYLV